MLRVLIVWIMLLAVPLQGFASATMIPCAPTAAGAQHEHDHESMPDDAVASTTHQYDEGIASATQGDHHPAPHHQSGKCATCATCGACVAMAPSFLAVLPVSAGPSLVVPFDQQILPSVDLALPERPPRA
jgi:hypothetical protein